MPMRVAKGEMYPWVSHLKNYLGGACLHHCNYCYVSKMGAKFPNVRKKYSGKPRLHKNELTEKMEWGKSIFVQNNGDLFAKSIPSEWIIKVLSHCNKYPHNIYLFQTKNPARFHEFIGLFPKNVILGTTIETNRDYPVSKAPKPSERVKAMIKLTNRVAKMVSIEPIMDFDDNVMVRYIKLIQPKFVSIGADSRKCGLKEPPKNKIEELIEQIKPITEVRLKPNLERLLK